MLRWCRMNPSPDISLAAPTRAARPWLLAVPAVLLAAAGFFATPRTAMPQGPTFTPPVAGDLLPALAKQQEQMAANQAKIDEQLATLREEIRLVRIFSKRAR